MSREEFLSALEKRLSGLPKQEIKDRVDFYREMIDDRIEEGAAEEDAVSAVGSVDEVYKEIIAEIPLASIVKERIKPKRRLAPWECVLLALGSPIWLSLIMAAFAILISVYAVIWSVTISLWAIFVSFAASAPVGLIAGIVFLLNGGAALGLTMIGSALLMAGSAILLFFGCKETTKATLILTKIIIIWTKNCFVKKEES